jgi:arylsulfatase A-like enzyme
MNRRQFFGTLAAPALAPGERPNILLLMTDQQGVTAVSAHGNRYLRTPAMDSLAASGVSFTESYSTYPVCSPARSSWFTSRMPHETGVRSNGLPIAAGIPTLGELFRRHGYHTVYGGKWHLPRSFGEPPGFEYLIGGSNLGAKMDEPLASACVEFLSKTPREPFLLVASFMNPHDVCSWIREHPGTRTYPDLTKFPPAPGNLAVDPDEPEHMQHHRYGGIDLMSQGVGIAAHWKRDDFRFYLHDYYRLVEDVDRQIGRVLAALRQSRLAQKTFVLLTSDHGEGQGAHRWVQKAAFWEETAKVPMIIAGWGVQRRGVVDHRALVSGLDILPTVCDYAGVPAPEIVRGRSLRAAIDGAAFDRPFVVSEVRYGDASREGRMLRTARYKYVVFNGGSRPEQLFDLELDPGEVLNLARRPEAAPLLTQHRQLLAAWIRETQDDFRPPV